MLHFDSPGLIIYGDNLEKAAVRPAVPASDFRGFYPMSAPTARCAFCSVPQPLLIGFVVRLWGVDAPEMDDRGFQAATDTLTRLALGKRITCREIERDRYGRSVARCFLSDGQEINRLMIESGTAKEYRRFTKGFYSR